MKRGTAIAVVTLGAIYMALQVAVVRPHLWPAGHGARTAADATARLLARPPDIGADAITIVRVRPGSPADAAGLRAGDVLVAQQNVRTGAAVDMRSLGSPGESERLLAWRHAYRMGVRDPLRMTVRRPSEPRELHVDVTRPAAWSLGRGTLADWARAHVSPLLQIIVFIALSAVLLALRARDPVAGLAVLALALCAVAAGGPPLGGEYLLPSPLSHLVTLFAWLATPLAFLSTAFAIACFPRRSAHLVRYPALAAIPFVVTAPMFVLAGGSGLFLASVDAMLPLVAWDAANPWLYFTSFTVAVAMNVAIVGEAVQRFRTNDDPNERRRVAISVITIVPGVLAYAIKEAVPGLGLLAGLDWTLPWWLTLALQLIVLLPAFGLTYVVAVHRVFAPATVLRRSVQYALAQRTLAILAMLPAVALVASLIQHRDMSIGMLVSGYPLFYLLTIAGLIAAIKYRDAERQWLDRRFFREAYDAREILLSLATRVTYETDPNELTAMVVDRIDTALHPEMIAVLVGGLEEGRLRTISTLRGTAPPLPMDSGIVTMLRWSTEPLELYVTDERSPAQRLPATDQAWLKATGAVLFVPVLSRGTADAAEPEVIALIALGMRRSEEPYTKEDRQLLASIAAQVALALDVARLRQRAELRRERERADLKVGLYAHDPAAASDADAAPTEQADRHADAGAGVRTSPPPQDRPSGPPNVAAGLQAGAEHGLAERRVGAGLHGASGADVRRVGAGPHGASGAEARRVGAGLQAGPDVGLAECPRCGHCAAPGTVACPDDGSAMRSVPTVPHVIERKYRVDRVIGRGGMGAVYRAHDVRLARDVAIKVVRADLLDESEARSRFRREAQIVARLQHPAIVSVYDYGTFADGSAFLVMELVRGEDLRRVLRRDGAMPPERALPLVGAMCAAVHAAHREGVLHRDLKPENIVLVDGGVPLKVLDFGIAKVVTERSVEETALGTLTGAGAVIGTPAYMAPEQLRGTPVDARTDVFSLGVMTYEMLTGDLPFGRASLWEIGARQAEGLKPSAPGLLPPHVEQAVTRALDVDPARRPQSAVEFAALLHAQVAF